MSTSSRNAAPQTTTAPWLPAGFVLLAGVAAFAAVASNAVLNARLEFEEVGYLLKAWWYITGALQPFSAADASPTLPVFPFGLGALQTQIGLGVTAARISMAVLGLLNGILLFLLCRKLTANSLASAVAVLLFIGTPATSYSFSTVSPIALISLIHLAAFWFLILSIGRPKVWRSIAMGVALTLLILLNLDMALPALMLFLLFMAAVGSARWVHGAIVIVVMAAILGAGVYLLPEQFTSYLLNAPLIALVNDLTGLAAPTQAVGASLPAYNVLRISEDAFEGVLLPYGGSIMLCVFLLALTARGPRILWTIPIYLLLALAALVVFRAPGCDVCIATAPSQVTSIAALGAAMTLAFLARGMRQKNLSGAPLVIGFVFFALALNTFSPILAERESLHSFPAEELKQPWPAAEQEDIATLMRFIGQNVPPGSEPILLIHKLPALPYATHMAGRRFSAVSINPLSSLRSAPSTSSGTRREAALAAIEQNGGWSGESLRRWIERDYELIIWQEGALAIDPGTTALLNSAFEAAATTAYRGVKLTLYKRKT